MGVALLVNTLLLPKLILVLKPFGNVPNEKESSSRVKPKLGKIA